jgi:hypothetical protein
MVMNVNYARVCNDNLVIHLGILSHHSHGESEERYETIHSGQSIFRSWLETVTFQTEIYSVNSYTGLRGPSEKQRFFHTV